MANLDFEPLTDAEWREFQAIPEQGYSHRHWVNYKMGTRVEALIAERDALRAQLDAVVGYLNHCRMLRVEPTTAGLSNALAEVTDGQQ